MKHRVPLIGLLAAVVLAAGFWFLVWSPKSDEQAAYDAETVQLEQQVATLESEIERLEEIQANEPEYQAKLARLLEYVPEDAAQPVALKQVQQVADLAGVTITSLSNGDPVLVEGAPPAEDPGLALVKMDVTMTADGGYFQQVDLLRRLEVDVPRALLIRNVTVAEAADGFPELMTTWSGELFAVVPVEAAPPPAPAPGETPAPGTTPAPGATPAPTGAPAPTGDAVTGDAQTAATTTETSS